MMDSGKKGWLDEPRNVDKLFYGLGAACAALLVAGLFVHGHHDFRWEGWIGFFALAGFVSYAFIVLAGRLWRKVVSRREEYYDD